MRETRNEKGPPGNEAKRPRKHSWLIEMAVRPSLLLAHLRTVHWPASELTHHQSTSEAAVLMTPQAVSEILGQQAAIHEQASTFIVRLGHNRQAEAPLVPIHP
jgi:hypothetical protein